MRTAIHALALGTTLLLFPAKSPAQGTAEDYARALRFLPEVVDSIIYHSEARPNWIGETDQFWYRSHTRQGDRFLLVDPVSNIQRPAFDHDRMAASLSILEDTVFAAGRLPFERIEFTEDGRTLRLFGGDARWRCDLESYACGREVSAARHAPTDVPSPDGNWVAFLRDHDLWIRSTVTGEEVRLSSDGSPDYDYTASLPNPVAMARMGTENTPSKVAAIWSPDSRRILSWRMDRRSARTLTLVQSVPKEGLRPVSYTYSYALPGDVGLAQAEPVVFDISRRRAVAVETDPLPRLYYSGPWFEWSEDGTRAWFLYTHRGNREVELREIDAATGHTRVMIRESADTHIDPWIHSYRIVSNGSEIIWSSERDGWNHLYLYDARTGRVKNQITRGSWAVHRIMGINEEERVVYFTAGGRETGRDPYLRHLYRVGFDGKGMRLLTPESADHEVVLSPSLDYVVDTYSTIAEPPVVVLRRTRDGKVVRELERADIQDLLERGWRAPEPFRTKARDGETDIYGVIWRPSNFDTTRSYPIIEQIYTGPHGFHVPKSFQARSSRSWPGDALARPIAELGFIVIMVDGLGTNGRSREFGDVSYKNLGDGGIPDHIAALRQLAARYPYMDLSRVGIFGHSAGGYDAMHAMLTHPDFYKVGVSSAGNHDHRLDKASWNETWMGFPVGRHYAEQSNIELAHRLQGKVLLVHGELDENVHPANTIALVDALIAADKDFEMLIVPNRHHGLDDHSYVIRKRWDFFVRHLLDAEPPPRSPVPATVSR